MTIFNPEPGPRDRRRRRAVRIGEHVLLDVREADEWEAGHAPGARLDPARRARAGADRDPVQPAGRVRLPLAAAVGQGRRSDDRVGLRSGEHGRRHAGVGRRRACPSCATTNRPGSHLSACATDRAARARRHAGRHRARSGARARVRRRDRRGTGRARRTPDIDGSSRTSPTGTTSRAGSSAAAARSSSRRSTTRSRAASASRRSATSVCEMNRLWVRAPYRRFGLGRRLAVASMDEARPHRLHAHDPRRARRAAPSAIALYRVAGLHGGSAACTPTRSRWCSSAVISRPLRGARSSPGSLTAA